MKPITVILLALLVGHVQAADTAQLERQLREQIDAVARAERWVAEEQSEAQTARGQLQTDRHTMRSALRDRSLAGQALNEAKRNDTAGDERLIALQAGWTNADDAYWQARRAWEKSVSGFNVADGVLARAERQFAEERSKLSALQLAASEASAHTSPAFLTRVTATQNGVPVYDAVWIEREAEIDNQIKLLRIAIDDQRLQVRARADEFDAAYADIEDLGARMDLLSAEYASAIRNQAYRTILAQTSGAMINIALGAKQGGVVSALSELFSRGADVLTTDYTARYDLPVLGAGPSGILESIDAAVGVQLTDGAVPRYKEVILTAAQAFAGGSLSIEAIEDWKVQVWLRPKLENAPRLGLGEVRDQAVEQLLAVRNGTPIGDVMRGAVSRTLSNIDGKQLLSDLGRGFVVDVAEAEALALFQDARIEVFKRWVDFDLEVAIGRKVLQTVREAWQQERLQLQALYQALNERMAAREQEHDARTFHVPVDSGVDRGRPLQITLEFSRDVDEVRAILGGYMLDTTGFHFNVTATLTPDALEPLPDIGQLHVVARDLIRDEALDSEPGTRPRLAGDGEWHSFEPGADTHHSLRLGGTRELEAADLAGLWIGEGYTCEGIEPGETVEIQVASQVVTATKVSGDSCISAGSVSWTGSFDAEGFPVRFHVSNGPGGERRWLSERMTIVDDDTIQSMGVTFRRIVSTPQ